MASVPLHKVTIPTLDHTIIVLAHDITKPKLAIVNGETLVLKDEIALIEAYRLALLLRLQSVVLTEAAITKNVKPSKPKRRLKSAR